ncbi:MAG: DnaJ domain-containing protein [Actinomycetota bacterium]
MPTHYDVLAVAPDDAHDDIRRAYHRAARRWHPDRFVDSPPSEARQAENRMRQVNEAWSVLGDSAKRKAYDLDLRVGGDGRGPQTTSLADDDGVIRIDPRLLDPDFLAQRRHAHSDEISNRSALVLRAAPFVLIVGMLAAIFVFTAYARDGGGDIAPTTTVAGPSLGSGIEANDCVSVLTGPSLLERPCGQGADGMVIGARLADGVCPIGTIREVFLTNGAIACLGPAF